MLIEVQTSLFRYDIIRPPEKWDVYYKNPEYHTEEYGPKNKAGLFFFTDSIEIALDLGKSIAVKKHLDEYFITKTRGCFNMIDFGNRNNIYQMLCLLKELNVDILNKDFKTYEGENTFEDCKIFFEEAELAEANSFNKVDLIQQIKVHTKSDCYDIGLFGQRLTDFENGIKFKKIFKKTHPEIDGYRWREFKDERGLSYCLFNADKLGDKQVETINITLSES